MSSSNKVSRTLSFSIILIFFFNSLILINLSLSQNRCLTSYKWGLVKVETFSLFSWIKYWSDLRVEYFPSLPIIFIGFLIDLWMLPNFFSAKFILFKSRLILRLYCFWSFLWRSWDLFFRTICRWVFFIKQFSPL